MPATTRLWTISVFLADVAAVIAVSACEAGQATGGDPLPALVKVRYLAGHGEEFTVRDAAGIRAVLAWLDRAESGPMSEHERIGLCTRDAEMYFYGAAQDSFPSRTIFLYIKCGHVSGHVVKPEQFAELRRIVAGAGEGAAPPPAAGAAAAGESRLIVQLGQGDAKLADAALAELLERGRLAQSAPAIRGAIEITAFAEATWRMPTHEQATPLIVGVRAANAGKEGVEFWPAKLQPLVRWGGGEAQAVGEESNVSAVSRAIQLGAGESRMFLVQGARLAYIGTPKYLAFYGNAFRPGAVYELALKGMPGEAGVGFQYAHDKLEWLRTDEIKCRIEGQPPAAEQAPR